MASDPTSEPRPADPSALASLAPGLIATVDQAMQLLGDGSPQAAQQAHVLLRQGADTLAFIGATSLESDVAALLGLFESTGTEPAFAGDTTESVQHACRDLRAGLVDIEAGMASQQATLPDEAVRRRPALKTAIAQLTTDLGRLENLLDAYLQGRAAPDSLHEAKLLAQQLATVGQALELTAACEVLRLCAVDIGRLPPAGVGNATAAEAASLARLAHNVAALSLSLPLMHNAPASMTYPGKFDEESVIATPGIAPMGALDIAPPQPDEIDPELREVFLLEAYEVLGSIRAALAASRAAPQDMAQVVVLRRGFHTLKGSGRMVGLNALGRGAMALEEFASAWAAAGRPGTATDYALLEYAVLELSVWIDEISANGNSSRSPEGLLAAVAGHAHGESPSTQKDTADHTDTCQVGDLVLPVRLHQIYSEESANLLDILAKQIAQWQTATPEVIAAEALRATHSLKSSAASVRFAPMLALAQPLDDFMQFLENYPGLLDAAICSELMQVVRDLQAMQHQFAARIMPSPRPAVQLQLQTLLTTLEAHRRQSHDDGKTAPAESSQAAVGKTPEQSGDLIDPELLDIFLEEGRDLLPQIGESLYKLQKTPGDTALIQYLLRPLHTIKGSARMAGAMHLGQHMHDLESRIGEMMRDGEPSAALIDDLLARYDQGLQLFDALQAPVAIAAAAAAPVSDVTPAALPQAEVAKAPAVPAAAPAPASPAQPPATAPLVRIRAGILDSVLNQAGEISISRSGLESEVNVLRQHLTDLGSNVARLSTQLREVEIQAEIQIAASNQKQPQNQHFDPLEFDRFTHLQELTRMLAESVNDVASLQKNLVDAVDRTQNGLVQQARLTRDMQRELMHARMVQFKGVEERLQRLVRQMAKETGKELKLDIVGGAVELDRSILEKMVGPFEHLLRNAAAHGIEGAEQRLAAGKDVVGRLLLEVRQEGNEAMIRLSDDGQGLDLARIHEKALHLGLIVPHQRLSDAELTGIIFHPGFSTSSNVTAIAGRGVGMDVVRSEVASLGGRISIATVAGKGAQFIIHLPLSLAIAQVVLLELDRQSYAIPSLLVEQVLQIKRADQERMFREGLLEWQGRSLPLHYLSALLGDERNIPQQQTLPVLVVKSGHDFLAILVDRVVGNREVVTKSIGPQLAGMTGVVGATVLGSGSIVLILNPIQLVQRHGYQRILRREQPQGVDGGVSRKIVLVVDDSLTVRRVMHRLLTREGYQVVLATDGVDGLHQMQAVRPDIVLLDIEMPRMDGFDLTRNIRDMAATATLPIIMITSRTAAKHRERAMELGVNAYLGKPYQDDVLLDLVHGLIENNGVRPEFRVDDVLFFHETEDEKGDAKGGEEGDEQQGEDHAGDTREGPST
ncbi:hybrid sensor histidine kinase/response regulator [Herbaspirillum hiltneri]|uniref:hybrid sensor histidine kinase/response regulator n=1 Tax=Herbaspirillum hiltneri TaxID=341045 RepID=UPI00069F4CA1|nr:response regulator [Herbaspirillum hiltneri]